MHFLLEPPTIITPNAEMDESGLEAVREFVDKLILLGVFREIDEGMKIFQRTTLCRPQTRPTEPMALHCGYEDWGSKQLYWHQPMFFALDWSHSGRALRRRLLSSSRLEQIFS